MDLPDIKSSMRIDVYSHGFKVSGFDYMGKKALLDFCRGLAQYGLVKVGRNQFDRQMLRVFAATTKERTEFRFHRHQYQDFLYHLAAYGIPHKYLDIHEWPMYEPEAVEFKLKDTRPPREKQVPIIEYMNAPGATKVTTLQTGGGKTFIGLRTTSMIGQRTALVLKGMYVEKWIPDVEGHLDLKKGDLMVVRGADHLAALMHLAIAGELKAKFIIITSKTMFNYMKTYEALNGVMDEIFPIPPDKFYETIRAGVRIIDEVHQDFHCNFRQDLYTHIPKTISLSATLDSDDQFMNRMYEIVFPQHLRAPEQEYHRFIEMIGLEYSINDIKRVRLKGGSGQYSHAEVEKSLMRNKQMLQNYFDMITAIAYKEFISVFEKGQSMLIQFSLKEMCTQFVAHLKRKYPHLEVNRYIDEDDYEENFMKGDIVVSTIGSSGTAVDRPNLRVTFMTVALSSKQSNIQVLGRTRPLKDWPDVTPKFLFLSCREIPKHREYTEGKLEKLDGKVLSSKVMQTGFRV